MDSSLAEFDVNVCWPGDLDAGPGSEGTGFVVDWGSLYDFLTRLEDRRDPRGVRYPLAWVLTMALLAKLAGEDRLTGIAEWVQHRKEALARALGLPRPQAPHRTTYSRILGSTLSVEDFEGMAGAFFAQSRQPGATVQLTIDGKTLRGSIGAKPVASICWRRICPARGWCWLKWRWTARKTKSPRPRDCWKPSICVTKWSAATPC